MYKNLKAIVSTLEANPVGCNGVYTQENKDAFNALKALAVKEDSEKLVDYMGTGKYPRYGTHVVAVDMQSGEYRGTIYTTMGGNSSSASIIIMIVNEIDEYEFEKPGDEYLSEEQLAANEKYAKYDDGYLCTVTLYDDVAGESLEIDGEDVGGNIIGVRVVGYLPKVKK